MVLKLYTSLLDAAYHLQGTKGHDVLFWAKKTPNAQKGKGSEVVQILGEFWTFILRGGT